MAGAARKPDDNALLHAHAAILKAREAFLAVAEKDIERLAAAARALSDDTADAGAGLREIGEIAREIRDFGTPHGFPLLSTFGASLQKFVEGGRPVDAVRRAIVAHHVAAMRNVVRDRIDGNGGGMGADLTQGLRAVVAKFSR